MRQISFRTPPFFVPTFLGAGLRDLWVRGAQVGLPTLRQSKERAQREAAATRSVESLDRLLGGEQGLGLGQFRAVGVDAVAIL